MNRNLLLLPVTLFIFCAGCASPSAARHAPLPHGKLRKAGTEGPPDTGAISGPFTSNQSGDGFTGFLKAAYGDSYSTTRDNTTWQYKLHSSGTWSTAQSINTTKELSGGVNYDIKFTSSIGDTINGNPYINIPVVANRLKTMKLTYKP